MWPFVNEKTGGYNKTGLALALLALYEFSNRPSHNHNSKHQEEQPKQTAANPSDDWLPSAIALGSLIFGLHTLLSDSSTLIAWSWTGFQNGRARGPIPSLHGSLTLVAQSFGLLIPVILASVSSTGISLLAHPLWFIYGAANFFMMYSYRDWLGYAGGLGSAVFLMSIIPVVLQRAAHTGLVAKTYFTAWAVCCLFSLANVWTVAYAFVPGGVYLRERTDLYVSHAVSCQCSTGLIFSHIG